MDIRIPIFQPVVGGIIYEILRNEGQVREARLLQLKDSFKEFLYDTEWEGGGLNVG